VEASGERPAARDDGALLARCARGRPVDMRKQVAQRRVAFPHEPTVERRDSHEGGREVENERRYVPALGYGMLTGLYDPVVALLVRERTFKRRLIRQAGIRAGHAVLDVGCGTGTLAIWVEERVPGADIVGIDGDPRILVLAQRKARKRGVAIRFDHGYSTSLSYARASFDRVLSSLLFHHRSRQEKARTVREVFRVLKPGGEFQVADWGKPGNAVMSALFLLVRVLDGFENTRENVKARCQSCSSTAGSRMPT